MGQMEEARKDHPGLEPELGLVDGWVKQRKLT